MATLTNVLEDPENISQVEYDALRKVFQWIDDKNDGRLDAQELHDVRI
jgi:Ca2+-binding EF-hand superfamily protein